MVEQAPIALFKPASVKPLVGLSVPTLASLPIDQEQFKKALHALLAHVDKTQLKREQETLLGEQEEKVYLVVGLIRPAEREQHKPISLSVFSLFILHYSHHTQATAPPCHRSKSISRHPFRQRPSTRVQNFARINQNQLHLSRCRSRQAQKQAQDIRSQTITPQASRALPRR